MKSQSIVFERTGETTKIIAGKTLNMTETEEHKKGKLHFALRCTKRVTLTLHVNKSPPRSL
jgi:hypothetical protein